MKKKLAVNKNEEEFQPYVTKTGQTIVAELDVSKLLDIRDYYSWKKGVNVYFFDDPKTRRTNYVIIKCGKNKYLMRIAELLINLIFWRVNVTFEIPITDEYIYSFPNPSASSFVSIIEKLASMLIDKFNSPTPAVCNCISSIKEDLSELAYGYSAVICNTISIWNIMNTAENDPKLKALMNIKLNDGDTIKHIEDVCNKINSDLKEVLANNPSCCLYPYVRSGRIKIPQVAKILCVVGTRPDMDKTIFPYPIKSGYLRGLHDIAEWYMDSVTARDALMTKNLALPLSGFLSRETNRLCASLQIDYNVEDCGSTNYLNYTVHNANYLKMAEGKYYLDEESGELKVLSQKDTHLIGKTLKLRSIITCCCGRDKVCQKCVGTKSKQLFGTRIGSLPPIKSINPMSQKSLSAKHDLSTHSIEVHCDALAKYFTNDGVDYYLKPEYATSRSIFLVIPQDDIEDIVNPVVDVDDDTVDTTITLDRLVLSDNGVEYVIENDGMRISLGDDVLQAKKYYIEDPENSDNVLIPVNKFSGETPVFSAIFDTEEISKYLHRFISAVDRISIDRFHTYDELMEEMNKIILESGFVNQIIHLESVLYNMVRDVNDVTIRPDFSKENPPYTILKISTAIIKKDMYTVLSFQGLRNAFKDITLRKRYGTSVYDSFFRISPLY